MWRSKKFIIIAVLTILLLGSTLGGVAIAQADDQNNDATTTPTVTDKVSSFLEKVAEIYQNNTGVAIDSEALQQAITEAKEAMKDAALDKYLDKLVEEGKITQEQANEYKAWLEAKPSLPIDEFKEWWASRPVISGLFSWSDENGLGLFGKMNRVTNKFHGGFGMKFFGWCAPDTDTE
jgi:hypothetical protein